MAANAAKPHWLGGPGCQGPRMLRCSLEPESLLGSLGLKKRKENPHKSAIHCNFVTAAVSEAPIALDKLIRIKLIILASLQHQIAMPVAQVWWYITEDLVLPCLGWPWEEPMVPRYHFASSAAALESSDLQNTGPAHADSDKLIQACWAHFCPCSSLDLQRLLLAAAMGNQAWQLSHMPLPAESNPKPPHSGFLSCSYH